MGLIIKVIIALLFVFIFFSLVTALFYIIRGKGDSERIVKALTWRIGLSILLFIILFIAFAMGWITPHQI